MYIGAPSVEYFSAGKDESLSVQQNIIATRVCVSFVGIMYCVTPKSSNRKTPINHRNNKNGEDSWNVWPIVRNNYQRIAYEAYKSNETEKAILYDSMSLSCGYIGGILNVERANQNIDHQTLLKTVELQKNTNPSNKLIDFLSGVMGNNLPIEPATVATIANETDQQRFDELCKKCADLPQEWNVVQLSQLYSGYNGYSTTKDLYTSDAPIKITLFRDSLSEQRNNRPVSIVLDHFETGEKSVSKLKLLIKYIHYKSNSNKCHPFHVQMLSMAYEINEVLYKDYTKSMNINYQTFIQQLTQLQTKLLDDMSTWLGPWVSLLCGKIKTSKGRKFEQSIFKKVQQFCNTYNDITENQRILMNLIARRIDLLNNVKIKQGATDIAKTSVQYTRIWEFLKELKKETQVKDQAYEYYPCILLVDEILDTMPWEMLLKSQQFTRVHSIYLLFNLCVHYSFSFSLLTNSH